MKNIFLSFVLYFGLLTNSDRPAPFLGKWHNVSKTSAIEEVVFFPNNNVRLSGGSYAFNQWYSLSPDVAGVDGSFKGIFREMNVGKVVRQSSVRVKLVGEDLMELRIDEKKLILMKD